MSMSSEWQHLTMEIDLYLITKITLSSLIFSFIFYLELAKVPWFITASPSTAQGCKGASYISLGPCTNSTPWALESTVAEWDIPLLWVWWLWAWAWPWLRWQSLEVVPLMPAELLPLVLWLTVFGDKDFEDGGGWATAEEGGVWGWEEEELGWCMLSILVIIRSSGPKGRLSR